MIYDSGVIGIASDGIVLHFSGDLYGTYKWKSTCQYLNALPLEFPSFDDHE